MNADGETTRDGGRAPPPKSNAKRAPPGAPSGPARDLQNSKALVDKLKAGRISSRTDEAKGEGSVIDDDDDDVIRNPRIPVPLADTSLADEKRSADSDEERWERRRREGKASSSGSGSESDEREMAQLDSEVQATGFVSHRARRQLASGSRSPKGKADFESSPGRAAAAVVAPLNDIDNDDEDGGASQKSESILSVFQQPSFESSDAVAARERFFDKAGLSSGAGKETIGKSKKSSPPFAVTAHEHGFMPLSARRAYKGRQREGGMLATARNGAADEGDFFETDKVYCTILRDRFSSKMYPECVSLSVCLPACLFVCVCLC